MQTMGILIGGFVFVYLAMVITQLKQRSRDWALHSQLALAAMQHQLEAASLLRQRARQQQTAWQGYRTFVVSQRVREAHNVVSLYLKPQDGRPLPEFLPGQSVSLRVRIPGEDKPVERRYSLSNAPNPNCYRVTVKRVSDGKVSSHLLDRVETGMAVDLEAPRGDFHIAEESERPAVLIASGIGVAPFVSMLQSAAGDYRRRSLTLIYEVRDGFDHAMKNELAAHAATNDRLKIVTVFSSPKADDQWGRDYDYAGAVDVELLKSLLPCSNFDFYLSAPVSIVESLSSELKNWGVPDTALFANAFGADSSDTPPRNDSASTASTGRVTAKTVSKQPESSSALLAKLAKGKPAGSRAARQPENETDRGQPLKPSARELPRESKAQQSSAEGPATSTGTSDIVARLRSRSGMNCSGNTAEWNETVNDVLSAVDGATASRGTTAMPVIAVSERQLAGAAS